MGFEEEPVGAGGGGGIQQGRNEAPLAPARAIPALSGLLHRMGGVEDHRSVTGGAESREAAHVHHEVAVAKERAALGHGDFRRSARAHLLDRPTHLFGGHPLALLDVHGAAGPSRGEEQIGLPAQEGGDLQDIGDPRGERNVPWLVDVSQNRKTGGSAHLLERAQTRFEPRAARCIQAGAIGFVVRGLVDDANTELDRQLRQRLADADVQVVGFDDTRTRDEKRVALHCEPLGHISR